MLIIVQQIIHPMTALNINNRLRLFQANLIFLLFFSAVNAQKLDIESKGVKLSLEYEVKKEYIIFYAQVQNKSDKPILIESFMKIGTIPDFISSEGNLLNDIKLVKVNINDTYNYDSLLINRALIDESKILLIDFRCMFSTLRKKDIAEYYYLKRNKFERKSFGFLLSKTF